MIATTHKSDKTAPILPPQPLLNGQSALITGANSGIGKAIALAMGAAGAAVAVNYIDDEDAAQAVVAEIQEHGANAIAVHGDVSRESDVKRIFKVAEEAFGTLHILVNNAGLQQDAPFEDMTLAQWRTVLDVNLTGQFLCAREAVRLYKKRGVMPAVSCAAGKIICISSVHQAIPWAGHANYAASKGGVMLLMKSIAQEVAKDRIRVNAIAPGAVQTSINRSAWDTPEAYDHLMELVPYNRIGDPVDIGRAAVWLASDYADYLTGTTLFVDGGMSLYPGFTENG